MFYALLCTRRCATSAKNGHIALEHILFVVCQLITSEDFALLLRLTSSSVLWGKDMGRRKPHQCVVCSRVAAGAPNQTQLFCCDPYQLCWHTLLAYCNRTYNSWLCTTANVVLVVFCWRKLSLPRLGAFFRKLFQYFRNVIDQEKFLLKDLLRKYLRHLINVGTCMCTYVYTLHPRTYDIPTHVSYFKLQGGTR